MNSNPGVQKLDSLLQFKMSNVDKNNRRPQDLPGAPVPSNHALLREVFHYFPIRRVVSWSRHRQQFYGRIDDV